MNDRVSQLKAIPDGYYRCSRPGSPDGFLVVEGSRTVSAPRLKRGRALPRDPALAKARLEKEGWTVEPTVGIRTSRRT